MKFASFTTAKGSSYGIVNESGIVDAGRMFKDHFPNLRDAIAADQLLDIHRWAVGRDPDIAFSNVRWLPPIPNPEKILCIGLNYRKHVAESGGSIPETPTVFTRLNNTLVPHEGAIILPKLSSCLDYECELAIVIGRRGRHLAEKDALRYVAGYTCFNDGSVRDFQSHHSLAVGKNFVATGGCGPWIVMTDEIPDPSQMTIKTRLNGIEVQSGTTDDLIFSVPWIISYLSGITELAPGDVIATGTPHGVGVARKPPLWMKAGDVVEVDISQIGVLRNTITAE